MTSDRDYLSELESIVGPHVSFYPHNQDVDPEVFQRIFELEENELVNEVASKVGNARYVVVKSYVADRGEFEAIAQLLSDPSENSSSVAARVPAVAFRVCHRGLLRRWSLKPSDGCSGDGKQAPRENGTLRTYLPLDTRCGRRRYSKNEHCRLHLSLSTIADIVRICLAR